MPLIDQKKIADINWIKLLNPALEQILSSADRSDGSFKVYTLFRYNFIENVSKFSELISVYFNNHKINFENLQNAFICEQDSCIVRKLYEYLCEYKQAFDKSESSSILLKLSAQLKIADSPDQDPKLIFNVNDIINNYKKVPIFNDLLNMLESSSVYNNIKDTIYGALKLAIARCDLVINTFEFHIKVMTILNLCNGALKNVIEIINSESYKDFYACSLKYPTSYEDILKLAEKVMGQDSAIELIGQENFPCP